MQAFRFMKHAVLIGVKKPNEKNWQVEDYLNELDMLALNIGYKGSQRLVQKRSTPDNATFVGKGTLERIHQLVVNEHLDAVIFDDELSPAQQFNLERSLPVPVLDRTFVILRIFSDRAKTREARTQVELATLKYEFPRLKRKWSHLHRQMGHMGGRGGEGEKQLEIDRRITRRRMGRLEADLKRFQVGRAVRKKQRSSLINVALVGYTNTGKTTLLNQLTKAQLEADDRLFVTLDAASRLWHVDSVLKIVLSDTVGFIRKLPHDLVASFKSTLTEVQEADLLLHVLDSAHPHLGEFKAAVEEVVHSLLQTEVPTLLVFNKIDQLSRLELRTLQRDYPTAIFISASQRQGLDHLRERVEAFFQDRVDTRDYLLPPSDVGLFYKIREFGQILETAHDDPGTRLRVRGIKERLDSLERQIPSLILQYRTRA